MEVKVGRRMLRLARFGGAVVASRRQDGEAWRGRAGTASPGSACSGLVGSGPVGLAGLVWLRMVRHGAERQAWRVGVCKLGLGLLCLGPAGTVGLVMPRFGKSRHGMAGGARQGRVGVDW